MFEKWNQKGKDRWFSDVVMGEKRYIWYRGVVCWGLPMFVLMSLILPLIRGNANPYQLSTISFGMLIWAIGGYVFGWLTWRSNLKRYGTEKGENTET